MKRYHCKVFYPDNAKARLRSFTEALQGLTWQYSRHTLQNLKYRSYNVKDILLYIKDLKLDSKDIFEYYADNTGIKKAVYKIDYKGLFDLCIVISDIKNIVTIYINSKNDNHDTLNKNLYVKDEKVSLTK